MNDLVVVRGGGDIASGVIQKLCRSGFKVVVLEIENPSFIRRKVCYGEAVYDKEVILEGIKAVLALDFREIKSIVDKGNVAVLVDSVGDSIKELKPLVVVDAILGKKNLGTHIQMAPITVGLGPGFEAGVDVLAVIETMRGHNLGRLILKGKPQGNTGVPGKINGYGKERVVYSPNYGYIKNLKEIGDIVEAGELLAKVGESQVLSPIGGILRGLIRDGYQVTKGMKIGDIDPRLGERENCYTISDKARNIGGAVLEAIMYLRRNV